MAFFARLAELERAHVAFAIATVVGRRAPVSAHLGDRALVLADGTMHGFVGGSCSRDLVRREALRAIRDGRPRLVRIVPDEDEFAGAGVEEREVSVVRMGCASEGAVEVFVEPHVPLRALVVVGDGPVADALSRLAVQVRYDVLRVVAADEYDDLDATPGVRAVRLGDLADELARRGASACARLTAVVASQGHYDEEALATLLAVDPAFVGLLASRKRAASVGASLALRGVAPDRVARVQAPVGLDLGARSAGDVAIAILAQLVGVDPGDAPGYEAACAPALRDPVCGMEVAFDDRHPRHEHAGQVYAFCCEGCRTAFAAEPEAYLVAGGAT
ncbi:MAG TPA: XdhC family protein [Candidatus Sulfotelmatobacter sp.]|nr:XdhC family protein [Candidatus Sulfotelmatobacter sp.]